MTVPKTNGSFRWVPRSLVVLGLLGAHGVLCAQSMSFLQVLDLAKQNDLKYRMVRQDLEVRREQVAQAFAQMLPNVSFSYNRNDIQRTVISPSPSPASPIVSENKTLTLRQPIFRKALTGNHEKAKLVLEAAEHDFLREELDLSVRALTNYLEIVTAEELLETNSAQLLTLSAQLDYAEKASVRGFARKTDVLDVQSRLSSLESDRVSLQGRLALAKTALYKLIRIENHGLWRPSYTRIMALKKTDRGLQDWWTAAQERSPVVKSLQAIEKAAQKDVEVSGAGHLPTLDLLVQKVNSTSEVPTSKGFSYSDQQVGLQMSVPIYSGGSVTSAERQAMAAYTKAGLQLAYQTDQLQLEIQSSYNGLKDALSRLKSLQVDLQSKSENVRAIELAYKAGLDSKLSLLQAQERLLQTRYGLADYAGRYLQSWLKLNATSGQLDEQFLADFNNAFDDQVKLKN
jgi:outer membrane protein, protease secretion system